jgi:hypothetical protein
MTETATGPTDHWTLADWEHRLCQPPQSVFTDHELDGVPDPVQRFLRAAIRPGTPLMTGVRLGMHGRIKIGRWLPFTARQVLNPHEGTIWVAHAAGLIAGFDRYLEGAGAMKWTLASVLRLTRSGGPDVSRSTAGRVGAEGIWVPTALLLRFGVVWTVTDEGRVVAHHQLGTTPVETDLTLDPQGHITSLAFDRWGDPHQTGTWAWHRFGGEVTAHRTFAGLSIPSAGTLGRHHGTRRKAQGESFRSELTSLRPSSPAVSPRHDGRPTSHPRGQRRHSRTGSAQACGR